MANLEFYDKHNMVAYLKKPSGSEGFQDTVDFLNGSHMRYALTKNPTIYVSLIKKFWRTTTVRTVDNGEQEITAIVNGKEFTITEASVRRHLQLADVDGGSPRCQEAMEGSIAQTMSERVPTPPSDSPLPRFHTLGSDEGSMTLQELTVLCTTLSKKVESLEADLKQTKQVYGAAYTKLIMKGEDQPEDQLGVLSAAKVLADAAKTNVHTYTRRRRAVSTGSGGISTAGASMPVSTAGMVQESKRTKLQQEKKRLGHEATVRLQEELNEEERQRMARVHEAAHSFLLRKNGKTLEQELKLMKSYLRDYNSQEAVTESTEAEGTKRSAKEEHDEQSSKKQKTDELSQEELH
ncbi:hypothetical protein Tco_0026778 [Tanacetum coccineum]